MPGERDDGAATLVAGRYRLLEPLDQGSTGAVWRAADELLGRVVAVKRVHLDASSPAEAALDGERMMRETRTVAALHHPNIVSVFDVVVEDGELWVITEYVPSRSLATLLAALPHARIATIGAQTASALAAAHAAGIAHGDVEPDNVLITDDRGVVRLTDFGISSGTPAYVAPETARGAGMDSRSDVYSLGATLYAATEGHPPFGTDGVGRGGAPPPERAGPLTDVIRRLMADDPAERPTAVDACAELERLGAPPPVDDRLDVGRPRRARLALVLAVLVLLSAIATGAVATLSRPAAPPAAAPLPAAVPTTAPPTTRGIALPEERVADPCSMIDSAALGRFGSVAVDPDYGAFDECVVDVAGPSQKFNVWATLTTEIGLEEMDRSTVGPSRPAVLDGGSSDERCERTALASDTFGVHFAVGGTAPSELCPVADAAAQGALALLAQRGFGTRPPLSDVTPLADVDACTLLDPAALAILPGADGGRPGWARWTCKWRAPGTAVWLDYFRYTSFGIGGLRGEPVTIGGRPGLVRGTGRTCRSYITQRTFTTADGHPRVELVRITVVAEQPRPGLCTLATGLADTVVPKLPPQR